MKSFQTVTQTLHIPPSSSSTADSLKALHELSSGELSNDEVDKLRKDMRKLKDYLKTSVQERKMLVKKIGSLNERVVEAHRRKSVSPEKSTMTADEPAAAAADFGVQCSLEDVNKIASILSGLNVSKEVIDKLENVLMNNEDVKDKFVDLLVTARASSPASCTTDNSLPDPGLLDFDTFEEKDRIIREQAKVLEEYRMEIVRLRDVTHRPLVDYPTPSKKRVGRNKPELMQEVRVSDEEDSWSEPDVSASRKRMGISQHVLTLIERNSRKAADSSEAEDMSKQRRKFLFLRAECNTCLLGARFRCFSFAVKSFYSLDYTDHVPSEAVATQRVQDYDKIIQELQSHRKEIEKLQVSTGTALGYKGQSTRAASRKKTTPLKKHFKYVSFAVVDILTSSFSF